MSKELEELETQFILEEDMEHEDIKSLITRMLKFCRIDKNGYVIIYDKKLKIADKILLILSARYLANKLQQKLGKEITIKEEVGNKELAKMLREKNEVIAARLKDLKEDRKIVPLRRGLHKIASYEINEFLRTLEGRKNEK